MSAAEQTDRIPSSQGVLLLKLAGRAVQVVATSNIRDAVASRRGAESEQEPFDEIVAWRTGSSFEADLLIIDVAKVHQPDFARQLSAQLGVWWLRLDRQHPWRGWALDTEPASGGDLIGPFLDRASARRWAELLEREFELCREPAELRHAPDGSACPYKEMGLCRATCEGGESMEAYAPRLADAASFTARDAARRRVDLGQAMQHASSDGNFELAAALRDRIEQLPCDDQPEDAVVGSLQAFEFIAVTKGLGGRQARLLALSAAGWRPLGDVDARAVTASQLEELQHDRYWTDAIDPAVAGVIARELVRPRRGGPTLLPAGQVDGAAAMEAVRRLIGV